MLRVAHLVCSLHFKIILSKLDGLHIRLQGRKCEGLGCKVWQENWTGMLGLAALDSFFHLLSSWYDARPQTGQGFCFLSLGCCGLSYRNLD
jgi:hypothetical protein